MRISPRFLVIAGLLAAAPAAADEGMWLPSQAPEIAAQMKKAGLKLDPNALANLSAAPMNAIVSLGGCSAAFLSPEGLVATNHHCIYGTIQYNSKPERDYLSKGFLAATQADELPAAPGSRVFVIEELRDVTAQMLEGITAETTGRQRYDRLEANQKALVQTCEKQPSRRCDVRAYYGGSTYFLQQMLEIQDVRLVYAPAGAIGSFGGEVDNWQWPRHTGDFGFYRAYVAPDGSSRPFDKANVPYRPKSWLKVSAQGLTEGDFVVLAGFPGTTERHRTAAEAKAFFSDLYPLQQRLLAEYSNQIKSATAGDEAATIKYANALRGADNIKKKLEGQLAGAEAIGLLARKASAETAFREWAQSPARVAELKPIIDTLDTLAAEAAEARLVAVRYGLLNRSQLLSSARTIYRWSQEQAKPDAEREPGFQERDRRLVTDRLTQVERRFDPRVDRKLFEAALNEYRVLAPTSRNAAFDRQLEKTGLDRLYADTKLGDTQARLSLMSRTAAELASGSDPFMRLAVAMYETDMAREAQNKEREGKLQAARSAYMSAFRRFAAEQGRDVYPDANGSLRRTYGHVKRRVRDGASWTAFTTARGIMEKYTGAEPFDSPARQLELIRKGDFGRYAHPGLKTLPVNYLSTLDITNGNSGSSTLNAKGEFVGLAFDGTIDGIIADWWFDPSINRTIHVDVRYMLWVMDRVDGADRLLNEMEIVGRK
jgi:hypothetical protein